MSSHRQLTARRTLVAGLIVLACGVTACGVGSATDKDKIAKTTSTYLHALAHGDTATACRQLSPRARGSDCRDSLARRASQLTAHALEDAADAPLNITVHGSTASSNLGKPASSRLRLVKTRDAWRIESGYAVPAAAPTVVDGGRMVETGGGRSLYLKCLGSGRPTILLEAGSGAAATTGSTSSAHSSAAPAAPVHATAPASATAPPSRAWTTPPRRPGTCSDCSPQRTSHPRTCWSATPTAGCSYDCTRTPTRTRWPESSL